VVTVWRLVQEKYADTAFSGEGSRRAGGRFNHPGTPVVYTSESLALAELEVLVNLPTDRLLASYVAFRANIPEADVETLDPDRLPSNWRDAPAPLSIRAIGEDWIAAGVSVALRVPSAVVPAEKNVLLNPNHPGMERIEISGPFDPEVDDRLW